MKKFKKQITKSKYDRVWRDKRSKAVKVDGNLLLPFTGFCNDCEKYGMNVPGIDKELTSYDKPLLLDGFLYTCHTDLSTSKRTYWREAVKPVECYEIDVNYGLE